MAEARLYVDVIGDTVVAKRAAGVNADGSYPTPQPGWVLVSPEVYVSVQLGWRQQPDGSFTAPPAPETNDNDPVRSDSKAEVIWRKAATMRAAILDLRKDVTTLQASVSQLQTMVQSLNVRVRALEQAAAQPAA